MGTGGEKWKMATCPPTVGFNAVPKLFRKLKSKLTENRVHENFNVFEPTRTFKERITLHIYRERCIPVEGS